MSERCPFCDVSPERVVAQNSLAIAIRDGFPVAEGHTLVVPREHEAHLFDLPGQTQAALWQLVLPADASQVRAYIYDSKVTATGDLTLDAVSSETINALTLAGSVAIAGGALPDATESATRCSAITYPARTRSP